MPSKLVWIESEGFEGFGCSECTWRFRSTGPPIGESLAEMKQKYEAQCYKEFSAHVCTEHPPTKPQTQ
jgi:hypothetical protein